MTRVDFYQINNDEQPLHFACRLIDIAWRRGFQVHVHTGNRDSAKALDDLLWSFQPERFLPHALYESGQRAPIRIGSEEEPDDHQDVLVNLSGAVPLFFSRFERVAEVVPLDENSRSNARENYRYYRHRGYPIEYHQMGNR